MVLLPAPILFWVFGFLPGSSSVISPLPPSLAFFFSNKAGATAFTSQPFLVKHTYGLHSCTNMQTIPVHCACSPGSDSIRGRLCVPDSQSKTDVSPRCLSSPNLRPLLTATTPNASRSPIPALSRGPHGLGRTCSQVVAGIYRMMTIRGS